MVPHPLHLLGLGRSCAVALVVLAAAGCSSSTELTSDQAPSATTEISSTPTTAQTTTPSPTGETINGAGYSYAAPDGWEDVTSELVADHPRVDSAVRLTGGADDFRPNINVIKGSAGDVTEIIAKARQYANELGAKLGTTPTPLSPIEIDGETSIGQRAETIIQERDVVFVQRFALHEDQIYGITLTTTATEEDSAVRQLDGLLASWAWSS